MVRIPGIPLFFIFSTLVFSYCFLYNFLVIICEFSVLVFSEDLLSP
jgi:hypothetical protein